MNKLINSGADMLMEISDPAEKADALKSKYGLI